MHEKYLTPGEAAEALSVPVSWIYLKAERGEIPSRKIGMYRRFLRSELEAWIEKQRQGPTARATA